MTQLATPTGRRSPITKALTAGLLLTVLLTLGFVVSQATAKDSSLSSSSGVFVGTNDAGQFQLALEDAVQQAATAAGCCDIRISYKVLETTGQNGGFVFFDDINVKILAEW